MKKCAVFSGGIINNYQSIDCEKLKEFLIISADAGYLHAQKLGLVTDIIVGDFDTLKKVPEEVSQVIKHIPEKDDTDTMLAVKTAIENGCNYIEIYGALGGRFDHAMANIQTLCYALENGCAAKIISDIDEIFMLQNESVRIPRKNNYSLSVLSYTEKCTGVTLKGVKYKLVDAELSQSFPLGVCNEIVDDFATISVKSGKMLVLQSKI